MIVTRESADLSLLIVAVVPIRIVGDPVLHTATSPVPVGADGSLPAELADLIKDLTAQMMAAARDLQFELAARIRDEIADLKKELRGMDAAGLK